MAAHSVVMPIWSRDEKALYNNNNISMALFPVGNTGSKRLTNKIHAYVKISKIQGIHNNIVIK